MKNTSSQKTCTACQVARPLDAFGSDPFTKDGRNHCCKECRRERAKHWRTTHRAKAFRKSAKEAVIREVGRAGLTKDRIDAKVEELRKVREAMEEKRKARPVPALPPEAPPDSYSRHTLAAACGISLATLRLHRLKNTAGIEDAVFRVRRPGRNTLVLFWMDGAAALVSYFRHVG